MTSTQKITKLWQNHIANFLIIMAMIILGVWLNLVRPVWLKPPLFIYMPLMYSLLPLAWLPVLAISSRFRIISRLRRLLIGILLLMGNCFWFMVIGPLFGPELPYLGANGELNCHSTALPQTPSGYICEHRFQSSDSEYVVTYEFEMLENLPFMLLREQKYISAR